MAIKKTRKPKAVLEGGIPVSPSSGFVDKFLRSGVSGTPRVFLTKMNFASNEIARDVYVKMRDKGSKQVRPYRLTSFSIETGVVGVDENDAAYNLAQFVLDLGFDRDYYTLSGMVDTFQLSP
jgi:hypothetical protein